MKKARRRLIQIVGVLLAAVIGISGCHTDEQSSRWSTEEPPPVSIDETEPETVVEEVIAPPEGKAVPVFSSDPTVRSNLPEQYDARKAGRTSPVKDQGNLGTCWAFASLTALESVLRPTEQWDFSEDHMTNHPYFRLSQEDGGEFTMSMAYLLSWQGPVREEDDPYGDGESPQGLGAVKHVQEIQLLPSGDLELIKEAVLRCGGVQTSLYTTMEDKNSSSRYYNRTDRAYYYPRIMVPNHDVVIIGWDDNFPADLFPGDVSKDGAFLCQNSWGPEFGEDGCFYVSYWDANIGKNNVLYSSVENADNYDSVYQSDLCGWIGQLGYGGGTAWAVNIFQAADKEQLEAAGFYAINRNSQYEVYVVRHLPPDPVYEDFTERIMAAEGTLDHAGYYTVPLTGSFELEPGERFGVMIRLVTPNEIHPIAIEYDAGDGKSSVDLSDGEGYISPDGIQWQHVETEQKCNLCLKAYTSTLMEE
ncbi:MAG: lectin like domain-containing protein [Lachnospiraceae bacterium]